MPAPSKKMRRAAAIAEHHPEDLYTRNEGLKKMKPEDLHDYASTKEKGLPMRAPGARRRRKRKLKRAKAGY